MQSLKAIVHIFLWIDQQRDLWLKIIMFYKELAFWQIEIQ